ncbi:MAG: DUF4143 domain-containing protein [Endomicrobia bacterium]|nr:DUF4143 domain-containing protein [Endomicrobiia bacterium]
MEYRKRIVERELKEKLNAGGALLIRGPKSCGKTETATQFAKSTLNVDTDEQVPYIMDTDPKRLLLGKTPRLIDEWQEQPKLWTYIKREIDIRKQKAQFLLTGSSTPKDNAKMHSGAGRFTILDMRTMSWQEMGYSTAKASLKDLLDGKTIKVVDSALDFEVIVERMLKGGWPALLDSSVKESVLMNRAYIKLFAEADMSKIANVKRDPIKVYAILKSLARNISTVVDNATILRDIKEIQNEDISRPTLYDYLDAMARLMVIEDQPAWNTHIRSSASLRRSPKRHITDVSLAIASLGVDKGALLKDVKFTGFLFESLVIHDLRVYAQANDAGVYYYGDSSGLEVDAIIQKYNGGWSAFEVKLGAGMIEAAATNLKKLTEILDTKKISRPKSLNIITGTGISYTRPDGINIISLGSLGV